MDGCVYCKILKGEIPAHFIYEDDLVIAFLNLEQPNPYKVLVISRAHVETIYDLTDEQASAIFKATAKIARAVREVSKCEGMNLVQSNGKAGQQDVFHFHLHNVPRFSVDSIILDWDVSPASQETLRQLAQKIQTWLEEGI